MNEKESLYKQIREMETKIEKDRPIRSLKVIAVIAAVIFVAFWYIAGISSVSDLLEGIVIAVVGAVVYFFVSILIFTPLFERTAAEDRILKELQKRYDELNK